MLEQWRRVRVDWGSTRIFLVGSASVVGLYFVHPLSAARVLATLGIAAILIIVPAAWFQRNLTALLGELGLGILLNLLVPGLGIFPLFAIAADLGTRELNPRLLIPLFGVLGVVAAWGFVEVPGHPLSWSELVLLSAIFAATLWANRNGVRDHQKLTEAYRHLQEAHDDVRELAGLQERERIAHELHDVLGHSLTLIILKAQLMQERLRHQNWEGFGSETDALLAVARKALDHVRGVVEAHPPQLTAGATLDGLRQTLEDFGIAVDVSWHPDDSWPPQLESDILMMAQEAVTNILRHAGATEVALRLSVAPKGGWRLEVADNGRGIEGPEGIGITGLRRRADAWGGYVTIDSNSAEWGTRLVVTGYQVQHG
ncbi:MAG: sensor histidine kinase [Firmicutes bacterium]|nr:sensor histidine kinase [Bacillota bacterium]